MKLTPEEDRNYIKIKMLYEKYVLTLPPLKRDVTIQRLSQDFKRLYKEEKAEELKDLELEIEEKEAELKKLKRKKGLLHLEDL